MKFIICIALLLPSLALWAQNYPPPAVKKPVRTYELPDAKPFAATITPEELKILVDQLASPAFGGRETGEPGQEKAADFIASQFKAAGMPPVGDRNTYMQFMELQKDNWNAISLKVNGNEFKNRRDFYVYPAYNDNQPLLNLKEVVFVGFGIEDPKYSDYAGADVKGKAVIFYDGEPMDVNNKSLITGSEFRSDWSLDWKKKVRTAKEKGAVLAIIIDTRFEDNLKSNRRLISTYGWRTASANEKDKVKQYCNNIFVKPEVADAIFGKKDEKVEQAFTALRKGEAFKPVVVKSKITLQLDKAVETLTGANVIGFIEGTDSLLKKEYVFVTAHYDHLGQVDSVIYFGADDNASGTAGVIEIAEAFAEARRKGVGPKRSVVCMLVSGEEKGLLGSKYYTDFPVFPLKNTVVDINIDMIGRVDNKHADNPDYIYVIGAGRLSTELYNINEWSNDEFTKLSLDYTFDAPDDPNRFYERSDHYNFAEKGIPAIFYFNGTHADYHRPSDTPDKINFDALTKRAKLAFYTAWDVANRPLRLIVDKK